MKTKACSPGLALMSSKTFSSTSYRTSPSAGRGTLMVFGMGISCQSVLDGGVASLSRWCPGLPVTARHGLDEGRPDLPRKATIRRSEDPEPEHLLCPPGPGRSGTPLGGGHPGLRVQEQEVLGVAPQPTGPATDLPPGIHVSSCSDWPGRSGRLGRSAR